MAYEKRWYIYKTKRHPNSTNKKQLIDNPLMMTKKTNNQKMK